MNWAKHPCPVFSLNGGKTIIPNEAKVFETEKQHSLSWKGGHWQGDWAACYEQWDNNFPEKCNLKPLQVERFSHSVTVASLVIIKARFINREANENLCLQRELKPPHCTSEVLWDRQPATVELAMSEVKISWRERWRKQPKTSLILSFWRVKTKKRLGRKKSSYRTKSNVRAYHESPSSWVAYSRQPPSFLSCFFSTAALDLFSSVGRALDYRAGGPGFHSRGQTNTQGLKTTEKNQGTAFAQQTTRTSCGLDDHVKWWSRL